MPMVSLVADIRSRFAKISPVLNERSRRRWGAIESLKLGHGGIETVCKATGMSRSRLARGQSELKKRRASDKKLSPDQIRRTGGGRKSATENDPTLQETLERLVNPTTRGDPMSILRWTSLSTRQIAKALKNEGKRVSHETVAKLLRQLGYSLQANMKTKEGSRHIDRNAQFQYINEIAGWFLQSRSPVISVDSKKKELVGDFKNNGREWRPQGEPERVRVHDFIDKEQGKAIPYGVYDVGANEVWVTVGIDHDTAEFAGRALITWWKHLGKKRYPKTKKLLVTADGGGSNGARSRLWKYALQKVANKIGIEITMCHFPPGTSKWNKIEHKMFSFISMNWRGRPLINHEVILKLIGSTTTKSGLRIKCGLDRRKYLTGKKISKEMFKEINIFPHEFHPDWNYSIKPDKK
jgi:hypothetical protein